MDRDGVSKIANSNQIENGKERCQENIVVVESTLLKNKEQDSNAQISILIIKTDGR